MIQRAEDYEEHIANNTNNMMKRQQSQQDNLEKINLQSKE